MLGGTHASIVLRATAECRLRCNHRSRRGCRRIDVMWCDPQLTVRVKHLAGSTTLRHATLRGVVR